MKLNVLQRFTLLSVGATAVLAVVSGLLGSFALSRGVLSSEARVTAEAVRAITNVDLPSAEFVRAVREQDYAKFGYIWSHLSQIPEVFRVKFYDTAGRVVWSDEPRLIGKRYPEDEGIQRALKGELAVEMGETQKREHEFELEKVPEGEMLELYVPLLAPRDKSLYGVVEIYKRPAVFLANRRYWLSAVWAGTVGGGLVLFFSLSGLFRSALREQNRLHGIERQYAEVAVEMKAAAAIQKRLLPEKLPELPGYALAAFLKPSREIGGDFYDAYLLPNGTLCLSIADNMGHGIPGALIMADTHSVMAARAGALAGVSDVVRAANLGLNASAPPGVFVTCIFAELEPRTRRLVYCNAGHPPGLVARRGQALQLDKGGLPLGVEAEAEYEEGRLVLEPADVLLLYTDGLIEASNAKDELFNAERLRRLLGDVAAKQDPEAIIQEIREAVNIFTGGTEPLDDVAMLCLVVKS